jgi:dynein heavy chain 2
VQNLNSCDFAYYSDFVTRCPSLIDLSEQATEWLKTHLKESLLEVVNQQDSNFTATLKLAVHFCK